MIALVKQPKRKRSKPAWHDSFEKMLPAIVRHARIAFRYMPAEPREEAVQEVVALCTAAYVRLVEREKQHVASPTLWPVSRLLSSAMAGVRPVANHQEMRCRPLPNAGRDSGSNR